MAESNINASKGVSKTTRAANVSKAARPRAARANAKGGNGAGKEGPAKEGLSRQRAVKRDVAKDTVKATARANKTSTRANRTGRTKGPSAEERRKMIAEQAYLRAERRGFQGGNAEEDWLAAEADVDRMLNGSARASAS